MALVWGKAPAIGASEEDLLRHERWLAEKRWRRHVKEKGEGLPKNQRIPYAECVAAYEEARYRVGMAAQLLGVRRGRYRKNLVELTQGEAPPQWIYPAGTLHCNVVGWHVALQAGRLHLYENPKNIMPLSKLTPIMSGTDITPMLEHIKRVGERDEWFNALGIRYLHTLKYKLSRVAVNGAVEKAIRENWKTRTGWKTKPAVAAEATPEGERVLGAEA